MLDVGNIYTSAGLTGGGTETHEGDTTHGEAERSQETELQTTRKENKMCYMHGKYVHVDLSNSWRRNRNAIQSNEYKHMCLLNTLEDTWMHYGPTQGGYQC